MLHKSNLAAKIDFITLKAEVDKLDINEFFNFPSILNILKTEASQFVCYDKSFLATVNKVGTFAQGFKGWSKIKRTPYQNLDDPNSPYRLDC